VSQIFIVLQILTVMGAVVRASDIPLTNFGRQPRVYVEIAAGDVRRRTTSIKEKRDIRMSWDIKFLLYASLYPAYIPTSRGSIVQP
jgi:hypothetical protein